MTKSFNIALKIKGGGREGGRSEVIRPCHPPKKNNWNVHLLCITIERKDQFLLGVFWHIYKREDNRLFFQRDHIGQSYINSSESRIKSTTISE